MNTNQMRAFAVLWANIIALTFISISQHFMIHRLYSVIEGKDRLYDRITRFDSVLYTNNQRYIVLLSSLSTMLTKQDEEIGPIQQQHLHWGRNIDSTYSVGSDTGLTANPSNK